MDEFNLFSNFRINKSDFRSSIRFPGTTSNEDKKQHVWRVSRSHHPYISTSPSAFMQMCVYHVHLILQIVRVTLLKKEMATPVLELLTLTFH